ncbi:MAG: signal peptidase II [bacterium]
MKTLFIQKNSSNNTFLPMFIVVLLITIDQFTKHLALINLKPLHSMEVIKEFFYLTFVENTGAAFGMFDGHIYIFVGIAIFVTIISAIFYDNPPSVNNLRNLTRFNDFNKFKKIRNLHNITWNTALILLISGALGNMIDRIVRGYVVDMFHFIFWGNDFAVFNMADIYVCIGTLLLSITILFSESN